MIFKPTGRPIILDLCGGTGSWSRPYLESGDYDVCIVDTQEWDDDAPKTGDVRLYEIWSPETRKPHVPVRGILAAPPCTNFSNSGAWKWKEKGEEGLLSALSVVDACIRLAVMLEPDWWALENPGGRLTRFLGQPKHKFDPNDYGDPWTKSTSLWGEFTIPEKNWVEPTEGSKMHRLPETKKRPLLRSMTPPGFARCFFEANP